jgi:hypothetical protein
MPGLDSGNSVPVFKTVTAVICISSIEWVDVVACGRYIQTFRTPLYLDAYCYIYYHALRKD